jgi:hypothetical protein
MYFATRTAKKNGCVRNVNATFEHIVKQPEIKTVVLYAEWSNYTSGARFGDKVADSYVFDEHGAFSFGGARVADNVLQFDRAISYTLEKLKSVGMRVIIVMPTPEFSFHVPKTLAKILLFGESTVTLPVVDKAGYFARNNDAISILRQKADQYQFDIVDPFPIFCKFDICSYSNGAGQILYEDDNHLNYYGAQLLVQPIFEMIGTPMKVVTQ